MRVRDRHLGSPGCQVPAPLHRAGNLPELPRGPLKATAPVGEAEIRSLPAVQASQGLRMEANDPRWPAECVQAPEGDERRWRPA